MTEPAQPRVQRIRLGADLRRLRMLAGLSGREMGRKTGISQATLSRMENGQIVPSLPQVRAWAKAAGSDADARTRLEEMTAAALNEVTTFRDRLRGGLTPIQEDVRELESTTTVLRNFNPGFVPGLLQTAAYARHVLELAQAEPPGDIAPAVAARLERQAILADPGRRFEWVMTEAALRWSPTSAEPGMLSAQMDRLTVIAGLANAAVGIIPAGAAMKALPRCGFVLYDERQPGYQPFVMVETPHAAIYVSDPAEVDVYREQLGALRQSAVFGSGALDLIRSIATAR